MFLALFYAFDESYSFFNAFSVTFVILHVREAYMKGGVRRCNKITPIDIGSYLVACLHSCYA